MRVICFRDYCFPVGFLFCIIGESVVIRVFIKVGVCQRGFMLV